MRCSKCGVEVARVIPGKLPLCPQCDALLRPTARHDPPDDQPREPPPKKENAFQVVSSEIGQYKTQFIWLMVGVGVFCFIMLVLLCCTCGFVLSPGQVEEE